MDYTNQQLEQMLDTLPEDVKGVLFGFDTGKRIREIGSKYSLHIDKLSVLVDETNLVMFGITKPNDFPGVIQSKLGVTNDIAGLIVHDINEQIFESIRESLKKIHNEEELVEIKGNNLTENYPQEDSGAQITLEPIDKTILKESGIEIIDEPTNTTTSENLNRESVLNDIENPVKTTERVVLPPKTELLEINKPNIPLTIGSEVKETKEETKPIKTINIVEEKLTNDFSLPKKDSFHQLDPYREPI